MDRTTRPNSITASEVRALQQSFMAVVPRSDIAADHFFLFVFDRYPVLRTVYSKDLINLGDEIMMRLAMVVQSTPRYEEFKMHVRGLLNLLVPSSFPGVSKTEILELLVTAFTTAAEEPLHVHEERAWELLLQHLIFQANEPAHTQKARLD